MNLTELGQALQERRKAVGITKAEIARRVKVSEGYIGLVERGLRRPSKGKLLLWAKALGWGDTDSDPYTRQVLVLASHLTQKVAAPLPLGARTTPRLPFASGALHYPQPRRLERERLIEEFRESLNRVDAEFQRLIEKAGSSGDAQWQGTVDLMITFIKGMRGLVEAHAERTDEWSNTVKLLQSYLEWLEYRLKAK